MRLPRLKRRRFYNIKAFGKTYKESDRDFVANNMELVVALLDGLENKTLTVRRQKCQTKQPTG